jgi:tetratricopeptide (TPR) repeat protein
MVAGCGGEVVPMPAERLAAAGEEAVALLGQAREATRSGRYAEALVLVDSLLGVSPALPEGHYQRGLILMELYQIEAADTAFAQTLAHDPYHRGGWYKRGHVAFEQGDYQKAITRYQRQRTVTLSSPKALRAYYRETDPTVLAQSWLQIGRAYELLHRPDSARGAYEEVLAIDSTHAQASAWLSGLYAEQGQTAEALAHARRAWRHARGNPDFAYQLGSLLFENGSLEEALPFLQHTAAIQPWRPGVHYNLGRILTALGRLEEGQRHLAVTDRLQVLDQEINQARAAVAGFPSDPARWRTLADLLGRAGRREEQQQALAVARTLIQNAEAQPRSNAP